MVAPINDIPMTDRLPLIILAGSDQRAGPVPAGLPPEQVLRGCKGAHRLPTGRPLVAELVDRYRQSGRFADPIVVGPAHVYRGLLDCELIHVQGNLAATLACVREQAMTRFDPAQPLALSTCDILPTADEIRRLIEESYDPHSGCCFWSEVITAQPEELGASSWKPSYRVRTDDGRETMKIYPGHLVIVRPEALRIRLTSHLLKVAYRFRNRDMRWRHLQIVAHGLGRLIWEDMRGLMRGRWPLLSVAIPYHGLRAYYLWRRGQLSLRGFEHAVNRAFLHRRFQRHNGGRPVVFAATRILSFAKDIDTVAELAELGARVPCNSVS